MDVVQAKLLFLVFIFLPQTLTTSAQTCSKYTFSKNMKFHSCQDLSALQANLHWNYISSAKTVHVAYRAAQTSPTGWVAWAINPSGTGMVGSQAIIALRGSNGSVTTYPTTITDKNPSLKPSSLSFRASNLSAEYVNGEIIIFAILGPMSDLSSVNHVWQAGDLVSNGIPASHQLSGENIQSTGTIDFTSA